MGKCGCQEPPPKPNPTGDLQVYDYEHEYSSLVSEGVAHSLADPSSEKHTNGLARFENPAIQDDSTRDAVGHWKTRQGVDARRRW